MGFLKDLFKKEEKFNPKRREFLKQSIVAAVGIGASFLPFELLGKDSEFIVVVIDSRDRRRKSFGAVIENYCDVKKLIKFYNAKDFQDAIERVARIHNRKISPPRFTVSNGDKIILPKAVLKEELITSQPITSETKVEKTVSEWQSPFGNNKGIPLHYCYDGTPQNDIPNGLTRVKDSKGRWHPKRIGRRTKMKLCPHDLFGANRSNKRKHKGLDCWGKIGTKVYPIKAGKVIGAGDINAGFLPGNGNTVKIETDDGFTYLYLHLKKIYVTIGDRVELNTCIGKLGITGNARKENPHVHITLKLNDKPIDPLIYLKQFIT